MFYPTTFSHSKKDVSEHNPAINYIYYNTYQHVTFQGQVWSSLCRAKLFGIFLTLKFCLPVCVYLFLVPSAEHTQCTGGSSLCWGRIWDPCLLTWSIQKGKVRNWVGCSEMVESSIKHFLMIIIIFKFNLHKLNISRYIFLWLQVCDVVWSPYKSCLHPYNIKILISSRSFLFLSVSLKLHQNWRKSWKMQSHHIQCAWESLSTNLWQIYNQIINSSDS